MALVMQGLSRQFAHHRILWSRVLLAVTLFVSIFSAPPTYVSTWGLKAFELTGYAMLSTATLWRVWCLVFIGGSKDGVLSTIGPFSVVRNPLYLGNFCGAVGYGLAVGRPMLALSLAFAFAVLYPAVIKEEEIRLRGIFGDSFERYCATVPRWLPKWSQYEEPATLVVTPVRIRQGMLDAMWYLWAFAFIEILEVMHERSLVPYLF